MAGTILKQNNAETGLADGTTATTANSDDGTAGDAFDAVSVGASNSFQCMTGTPWAGSRSWRLIKASTNQNFAGWTWTGAQSTFAFRAGIRTPAANLTASEPILRMFSGAGYTPQVGAIQLEAGSGRKLRAANTTDAVNGDSSAGWALDTDYWIEGLWVSGVSLTVRMYPKGSTTPTVTATVALTTANPVNSVRLGLTGSSNSGGTIFLDDLAVGHTDWLARTDITLAATLTASTLSAEAGQPVTIDADVTGATGRVWRVAAITNGAAAPTLEAGASADQKIFRAPVTRGGCTVTIGYLPTGAPATESFLSIDILPVTTVAGAARAAATGVIVQPT